METKNDPYAAQEAAYKAKLAADKLRRAGAAAGAKKAVNMQMKTPVLSQKAKEGKKNIQSTMSNNMPPKTSVPSPLFSDKDKIDNASGFGN